MKKVYKINITLICLFCISNLVITAGEIDMLLDKLVEKGVLSGLEAQEIRYETEEQVKKEISLQTHKTLPYWLQSITIGGDIRLRYQRENNNNLTYTRSRIRERLRLYLNAKAGENIFVYTGISTGENADSRSTNQTFTDNFSKRNIYLDYAYFEYYPYQWLSLAVGRIKQAFWNSSDMLWDSDINQEGGLLKIEKIFSSNYKSFFSFGSFIIKENQSTRDQYFNYFSNLVSLRSDDNFLNINFAISYYDFKNIKGANELSNRPGPNYIKANSMLHGKYLYNYKSIVFDMEFSWNVEKPLSLYTFSITNLTFFSTYLKNTAISSSKNNNGWIFGFRIGQEKVSGSGDFHLSYSRRWLQV